MRFTTNRIKWMAGLLVVFFLCILSVQKSLSLKKEREDLRSRQKEISLLKGELEGLKNTVDAAEGRKSLVRVEGVVQAVDEVFRSLGLNQRVRSVKPLGTREKKFALEEEAEVQVEKVSMNEMTNIFYKIDTAPMALSIKKTTIKTSFDNPSLLNLTITVALVKPK
jgi:general secretion pathway protein M